MHTQWVKRWFPAILVMLGIFLLSSRQSNELPDFGTWDYVVKKAAHMLEYGLLSLAFWRGMDLAPGRKWSAWGLALGYAITDEIHQGFVPGRIPSPMDVAIFDSLGAVLGLIVWDRIRFIK